MDIVWLLIVIPVIVYVLSALMRGAAPAKPEEDAEAPPRAEGARRSEPTPTDVERFLAEINRRRRDAERQEKAPPPPRPARREERRPITRRISAEEARRLPSVQLADAPRANLAQRLEAIVEAAEPVKTPAVVAPPRTSSPIIAEVLPLLRSPKSVAVAIVLQEVLGPPRCRRR